MFSQEKEIHIPKLFLKSVEDISTRNLSAGIDINMSLNSSGMSKSSRTCMCYTMEFITLPKEIRSTRYNQSLNEF